MEYELQIKDAAGINWPGFTYVCLVGKRWFNADLTNIMPCRFIRCTIRFFLAYLKGSLYPHGDRVCLNIGFL